MISAVEFQCLEVTVFTSSTSRTTCETALFQPHHMRQNHSVSHQKGDCQLTGRWLRGAECSCACASHKYSKNSRSSRMRRFPPPPPPPSSSSTRECCIFRPKRDIFTFRHERQESLVLTSVCWHPIYHYFSDFLAPPCRLADRAVARLARLLSPSVTEL